MKSGVARERTWALYAPISSLFLPIVWLTLVLFGFMGMFWAIGVRPWGAAFLLSGSSLLTLGFAPVNTLGQTILAFLDATIGLILIALLIAYLPTMYAAFSKRETPVVMLEVYADSPPSPINLLARVNRIRGLEYLRELWPMWESWFSVIDESHTTFGPLSFFRSPRPEHSWVTAAGAVLDAASLAISTLDIPYYPHAPLCIRAGYLALQRIADFFGFEFDPFPKSDDPISITQEEFEEACKSLEMQGVSLKSDRD